MSASASVSLVHATAVGSPSSTAAAAALLSPPACTTRTGRQAGGLHGLAPARQTPLDVLVGLAAAEKPDPLVPQRHEVLDRLDHAGVVIGLHPGKRRAGLEPPGDDHRQPRGLQQVQARILELGIGEQEPVDPSTRRQALVGSQRLFGAGNRHQVEQQRVIGRCQLALDARQEAHEERVGLELLGLTREHQADRACARLRQGPSGCAGMPAQLLGRLEDSSTRLLADAGPAVDGERHRCGGHACPSRHVGDRRAPAPVSFLGRWNGTIHHAIGGVQ